MSTFGPRSQRRSPNTRPAIGGFAILRCGAALGLSALLSICLVSGRSAQAADEHKFRICPGYFALCAASTCTPTGKTISVNVSGDGTASFLESDCTCPILRSLTCGNMKGSCEPPSAEQIWSLYSVRKEIPQEINGWIPTGPKAAAPILFCSKDLNLGHQLVNCFSFACDSLRCINNVPVATCHCPIGESLSGTRVQPHTAFASQAGQGDQAFCAQHPVAGPIPTP